MTKSADPDPIRSDGPQIANQLMTSWADALAVVLESMTGQRPEIQMGESTATECPAGTAWWGQRLSILDRPSFWIGAPAESWASIGRLVLSSLGVDDASESDVESTCRDVLAQTSAMVATKLAQQYGEEITGGDSLPADQPEAAAAPFFNWSLDAGSNSIQGTAVCTEAFLARCSGFGKSPDVESSSQDVPPPSGSGAEEPAGKPAVSVPRLDLRVKFVLGRATLPLRDVFKLTVGSVVELDHSAVDPADVVIQGRVFARGQVVVINGNYGLKILPPARRE